MKLSTKELTRCALLTAMALALSYLENFFPLSLGQAFIIPSAVRQCIIFAKDAGCKILLC